MWACFNGCLKSRAAFVLLSICSTLSIILQTAEMRGSLHTACRTAWLTVSPILSNSGRRFGTSCAVRIVFMATKPIPALWQASSARSKLSPFCEEGCVFQHDRIDEPSLGGSRSDNR